MRKHSLLAITLILAIGLLARGVEAQEMRSSIEPPTSSESIGTFNKIAYVRHRGRFVGQTESGPFDVPYEITVPANPEDGRQVFLFEPPDFADDPVTHDSFLGSEFLFENGFGRASIGFGSTAKEVIDTGIIEQFALALKQKTFFAGQVNRLYAAGFSDSGNTLRSIYEPFGHAVFDLTFVCTTDDSKPVKFDGKNPIIVVNVEADVDALWNFDSDFPQSRYYAVAGGPHIPDSIAGTTPINWLPFARSLFIAGDEWVRNGTPPLPSGKLDLPPDPSTSK